MSAQNQAAEPAEDAQPAQPVFSVTKGEPTPEELAALTAVMLSMQPSAEAGPAKSGTRQWMRRQQLRLGPTPGPGAWKRSRG
ncbi:acyl-CoA carboxylase subunit epsilon [Arthrobacter sp. NPDC057009]|uniref:acyl-CoA carboxylase subunit epsilon n=1 Tax=Arthrobacter sp. NPDC057009 TaxID=3345996 RepID=UPI003640D176